MEQSLASEYGIKGYPTIKYFPAGLTGKAKKSKVGDYNGARSSSALTQHALGLLNSKLVHTLSGGKVALEKWVQLSTNPAPTRVLLLSNKKEVPPLLSALSIEFEGEVAFGFAKHTESEV